MRRPTDAVDNRCSMNFETQPIHLSHPRIVFRRPEPPLNGLIGGSAEALAILA